MRTFILLFLISLSSRASNWMPISQIQSKGSAGYQLEADCLRTGEQCLDVGSDPEAVNLGFASLLDEMIDDLESPIWATRSMVEICSDEADCKARHEAKECIDGRSSFYSIEDLEVWCNKIIGYNNKASGNKVLTIDKTGFDSYKAEKEVKELRRASIQKELSKMECGKRIKAVLKIENSKRSMPANKKKAQSDTYKDIAAYLDNGSLDVALIEIDKIIPDGDILLSSDIAAVKEELLKCPL